MNYLKEKAIELRKAGWSYNTIKEKIGVSKSTLSNWLSRIPFIPNEEIIKRIGKAKLKSALIKQKVKFDSFNDAKKQAKKDIGILSKRDLFFLGIGLYLGEGEKGHENIRLVNADPKIIKLVIKWFCNMEGIKIINFKPYIHLYPDNNIQETLEFWSKETTIPLKQFGKVFIDTRKNKSKLKKRKLPYGTMHLRIKSFGDTNLGVNLHRKIMSWIESCMDQI